MPDTETIAAISTPLGEGGIGIVRISGPEAFAVAGRIFLPGRSQAPGYPRSRHLYYGHIVNEKKEVIDEVLTAFMPAPYTYTREDTVEINCHSGMFALRLILELVLSSGARLAEPGEFTRRAYLNGRIDLSQAESVLRLIRARSEQAVKIAAGNLGGRLSGKIAALTDGIMDLLARLEAVLDFPEEVPAEPGLEEEVGAALNELLGSLSEILQGAERGRVYQEGIDTAIIGKPNAGKSSLLNALLGKQRAIVHETPGTTRDVVEGFLVLRGYPINLLDTAGVHGTADPVEQEGIARTRGAAERARLLLVVFDGSRQWEEADEAVLRLIHPGQLVILIVNKTDLKPLLSVRELRRRFPDAVIVKTAAIKNKGIDRLEEEIAALLDRSLEPGGESPMLSSLRQEKVLRRVRQNIEAALAALEVEPLELVALHLHEARDGLGKITGDTVSEELLDRIFSEFCLGK